MLNISPLLEDRQADLTSIQIAALSMMLEGKTGNEIAQQLGVCPNTVSRWKRRDPAFAAALYEAEEARREQTLAEAIQAGPRIMSRLVKIALNEEIIYSSQVPVAKMQVEVAQDILDRMGVVKVTRSESRNLNLHQSEVNINVNDLSALTDEELEQYERIVSKTTGNPTPSLALPRGDTGGMG